MCNGKNNKIKLMGSSDMTKNFQTFKKVSIPQ